MYLYKIKNNKNQASVKNAHNNLNLKCLVLSISHNCENEVGSQFVRLHAYH